jgi:hypothetical protein
MATAIGGTVSKAWEFLPDLFNEEAQQKCLGRWLPSRKNMA